MIVDMCLKQKVYHCSKALSTAPIDIWLESARMVKIFQTIAGDGKTILLR